MGTLLGNAGEQQTTTTPNGDGGADHWAGKLGIPADQIDDKIRAFKSPAEFVESYRNGQKLISSKGYQRPADDAPADAWDRFYGAIGRPAKADDYKWTPPEGVSVDDGRMGEVRKALHGAGLDPRQFAAVMNLYGEESKAQAERADREAERVAGESSAKLKADWGSKDFDVRLAKAKAAAKSLGVLDVLDETGLGDRYEIILAMDRIAAKIGEDSAVPGSQSAGGVDQQITDINERILKMPDNDPQLPLLEKQRSELFARKRGTK